jgi:hypothetical protein
MRRHCLLRRDGPYRTVHPSPQLDHPRSDTTRHRTIRANTADFQPWEQEAGSLNLPTPTRLGIAFAVSDASFGLGGFRDVESECPGPSVFDAVPGGARPGGLR